MKYILNRIWCLTISRLPAGFLTQLTPLIVTKGCGQNNKDHRKVQLAPAMTLYSQVLKKPQPAEYSTDIVSFPASAPEAAGGWLVQIRGCGKRRQDMFGYW